MASTAVRASATGGPQTGPAALPLLRGARPKVAVSAILHGRPMGFLPDFALTLNPSYPKRAHHDNPTPVCRFNP